MATSPAASSNPFDQFDGGQAPAAAAGGNPFDQFDAPGQSVAGQPMGGQPPAQRVASDAITQGAQQVLEPGAGVAGNPATRFAYGAARPLLGLASLGAHGVQSLLRLANIYPNFAETLDQHIQQMEDLKKAGMAAYGQPGGTDIAGMVGEALSPVNLLAGEAAGAIGKGATGLAKLATKMGQGAAIGATAAVTTPPDFKPDENYWVDKVKAGGAGALLGAAIPPALDLAALPIKSVYNVIERWLPGGAESILRRTANQVAGSKKQDIIDAIDQFKPTVAGEPATAAEAAIAANSPQLSALEQAVKGYAPEDYFAIQQAQNQARMDALTSISQLPDVAEAIGKQASKESTADYAQAMSQTIPAKAGPVIDAILQDPYIQKAMVTAREIGASRGLDPTQDALKYLQLTKFGLDKMLSKTAQPVIEGQERQAILDSQKMLTGFMEKVVPDYGTANANFAKAQKVLDQMQVGDYLKTKLSSAINEYGGATPQTSAAYARALENAPQTLKQATGFGGYEKLGQVLNPDQVRAAQGVAESLGRQNRLAALAKAGRPEVLRLIGAQEESPLSHFNILEHKVTFMKGLFNVLKGHATEDTLHSLAMRMQDPQAFKELLTHIPIAQRNAILRQGMQLAGPAAQTALPALAGIQAAQTGQQQP